MGFFSDSPMDDKVRKARNKATKIETGIAARETVSRNAKAAKVNLSMAEERKAAKVLQSRMQIDRSKTAARAVGIQKMQEKKAAARRAAAAVGNAPAKKKVPLAKKPTPKPTATKKPMTASEKAFIKNQKEKAKATKRTGVYPNTAN
jgi:hypothetical protein